MPPRAERQVPRSRSPAPRPTGGSIRDRIRPSTPTRTGASMLLYGEAGTGKTTFWATFPRPMLVLICEGMQRNNDLDSLSDEQREGVHDVVVEGSQELADFGRDLARFNEFATVVINHCTGLQDLCLAEVLKLALADMPVHKHFGIAKRPEWGIVTGKFKEAVNPILNLACNRVFVAHEKLDKPKEEDEGSELARTWIRYNLTPGIGGWLAGAVNNICQMSRQPRMEKKVVTVNGETREKWVRRQGEDFCLRLAEHSFYASKVRKPKELVLDEFLRDPSYEKFMSVLAGEKV